MKVIKTLGQFDFEEPISIIERENDLLVTFKEQKPQSFPKEIIHNNLSYRYNLITKSYEETNLVIDSN